MNFVRFVQFTKGQLTKKWKAWVISNGHVLMKALKIKAQHTCIKAKSLTVRTAKLSSSPVTGSHRWKDLSEEFPLVLSTVREVGHYSCRSMTGNCRALAALADEPGFVQMNDQDAKELGIKNNDLVWIASPRGKVISRADVSTRTNKGACYMTYQWWIGKCNELTAEHLNPGSRTPEYKYSAVRIDKIEDQAWAERYVVTEYAKLKKSLKRKPHL